MSIWTKTILAGFAAAATLAGGLVAAPNLASAQVSDRQVYSDQNTCAFGGCGIGRGQWREGAREWRDREWRGRRGWDDNWRDRHRPRYRDRYWPNSGFSVGVYVPSYRYVDPYYVEPRYAPRRVVRLSAAHVEWCYDRWRSYRERDNTYQPSRGYRKQCISPYS